jgi:membrane protein YdbS with pleckstrin-like domain
MKCAPCAWLSSAPNPKGDMIGRVKAWLLRILKVPPEPCPPAGDPNSVRVFRAARNFYRLRLLKWVFGQIAALVGILTFFPATAIPDLGPAATPLRIIEMLVLPMFIAQLPFTLLLVRFDYEMRWYIVTDRSLRIRYGIQQIREMTMSFANIQQITIQQGPLQRLLGIADLQVRTAGGGSGDSEGSGSSRGAGGHSLHLGYFRGVENANEIRDLMVARLRQWQDTGLGDPDEPHSSEPGSLAPEPETAVLDAARRLLAEAQALRKVLTVETKKPAAS